MRRKVPDTWWDAVVVGVLMGAAGGVTAASWTGSGAAGQLPTACLCSSRRGLPVAPCSACSGARSAWAAPADTPNARRSISGRSSGPFRPRELGGPLWSPHRRRTHECCRAPSLICCRSSRTSYRLRTDCDCTSFPTMAKARKTRPDTTRTGRNPVLDKRDSGSV